MLVLSSQEPKAAIILFAGGHGGLQISQDGSFGWGKGNFLVRTRQLFADQGLLVVVVDAPSDHQSNPYLGSFRQSPEHAADIKAVIAWLRTQAKIPVWLVGTSRGTQSAAYIATQLNSQEGPNGLVLTSTILSDDKGARFHQCLWRNCAFLSLWFTTNRMAANTAHSATFLFL